MAESETSGSSVMTSSGLPTRLEDSSIWCNVKPEALRSPEYGFQINYDFTLRRPKTRYLSFADEQVLELYQAQIDILGLILSSMLNTSGGQIVLRSWYAVQHRPRPGVSANDIDVWKNNMGQQLVFVSGDILEKALNIKVHGDYVTVFVKKSPELVTFRSHLFMRTSRAQTVMCHRTSEIRDIIQAPIVPARLPLTYSELSYGEVLSPETFYVEHKNWCATTADEVITYLEQNIKSILGFANAQGGDILIGIKDKTNEVEGLCLSQGEQNELIKKVENLFLNAIRGKNGLIPRKKKNWDIAFIPVKNCPMGEMQFVVALHINHFEEGLFENMPESYYITDKGNIQLYSSTKWKERIMQLKSQAQDNMAEAEADDHQGDDSDIEGKIFSRVSWAEGPWKKHLTPTNVPINLKHYNKSCSITEACHPLKITPKQDKLMHMAQTRTSLNILPGLKQLEMLHSNEAFAIGYLSWLESFNNKLGSIQHPSGHILDIFMKEKGGPVSLITFIENDSEGRSSNTAFMYQMCRVIKRQLLLFANKHGIKKVTNVCITLYVYYVHNDKLFRCTNENEQLFVDQQKSFPPHEGLTEEEFNDTLIAMLMTKSTWLRDRLGDEHLYTLTREQVACSLTCLDNKLNIIEGPPGSGKLIIISYLCDKFFGAEDNHNVLVLCPRKPFTCYMKYQKKCDVLQVDDGAGITRAIKRIENGRYKAVIADNSQVISCASGCWWELYDMINQRSGLQLFLILDNKCQTPEGTSHIPAYELLRYCSFEGTLPTICLLTKILRNKRKVFTFMRASILQRNGKGIDLTPSHMYDGDDVAMTFCPNLLLNGMENGLLLYVLKLVYPPHTTDDRVGYALKDIVVLADEEEQAVFYRNVFNKYWQACVHKSLIKNQPDYQNLTETPASASSIAHDFCQIPTNGIAIDIVDNFIGLESNVVIYVNSKVASDAESLENLEYRLSIVSRGIDRVDLLYSSAFTKDTAKQMGFEDFSSAEVGDVSNLVENNQGSNSSSPPVTTEGIDHQRQYAQDKTDHLEVPIIRKIAAVEAKLEEALTNNKYLQQCLKKSQGSEKRLKSQFHETTEIIKQLEQQIEDNEMQYLNEMGKLLSRIQCLELQKKLLMNISSDTQATVSDDSPLGFGDLSSASSRTSSAADCSGYSTQSLESSQDYIPSTNRSLFRTKQDNDTSVVLAPRPVYPFRSSRTNSTTDSGDYSPRPRSLESPRDNPLSKIRSILRIKQDDTTSHVSINVPRPVSSCRLSQRSSEPDSSGYSSSRRGSLESPQDPFSSRNRSLFRAKQDNDTSHVQEPVCHEAHFTDESD